MRVGVEIGNLMMKISTNSASWAGDREFVDDDDIGEQCEVGWR